MTPLGRARTVALWYFLLSIVYVSWLQFLLQTPNDAVMTVAALAVANAVMAALAFWYLRLGRLLRVVTLTASIIISILAVVAVFVFLLWHTPVSALLALGYCLCTYYLWKISSVASNNRSKVRDA
jgi:hypothetical protein